MTHTIAIYDCRFVATRCAPDVQSARLYQRVFGRPLHLPCPLYQCRGGQVLEQYNMTTRKYDIIDDGHHHLIGYNDGGSLRCSQRCNSTFRQYCYFKVQGNGATMYLFPYKVMLLL